MNLIWWRLIDCWSNAISESAEEKPLVVRIKQEVDAEEDTEEDAEEGSSEGCSRTLPRIPDRWLRKLESRNRLLPGGCIPVGIAVARQRTDSASKSARAGSLQMDTHPVPCTPHPIDLSRPELYINAASSGLGHFNYSSSSGGSIYSVHPPNWRCPSNPTSAEHHLNASAPAGVWPPPPDVASVLGYPYPASSSILSATPPVAGLTTSPYLLIPAACLGQFPFIFRSHSLEHIRTTRCGCLSTFDLELTCFKVIWFHIDC